MVEIEVVYCDHCGKKITEKSYSFIHRKREGRLDFHSYSIDCIGDYKANLQRIERLRNQAKRNNSKTFGLC